MERPSNYDINKQDIRSVQFYRSGIVLAALAFVLGTALLVITGGWRSPSGTEWIEQHRFPLYTAVWGVAAGTGISVLTIHLYIRQFHTFLKILFGIGVVAMIFLAWMGAVSGRHFLPILYEAPYGTLSFGFVLAALCGIAVKEAFCFGRAEAILFALVTPMLILGHIFGMLGPHAAFLLLCADTLLLCIFAVRKVIMPVDLDIGDKSIYT